MAGVGIDFGTTNSLMVGFDKKSCEFIYFNYKNNKPSPTSSTVWYHDNKITVGNDARREMYRFGDNEAHHFEKSIKLKLGTNNIIDVFGKHLQAYEIASTIISSLRNQAIDAGAIKAGIDMNKAVFTVPINFSGKQRRDLRKSANDAGFEVKTFIHEPFAAVVGYYFSRENMTFKRITNDLINMNGQYILTFDWGGGTLDITVIKIENGKMYEYGTGELTNMAGDKIDEEIATYMWNKFLNQYGDKYSENHLERLRKQKWGRMVSIAEQCKIDLSYNEDAEFDIDITADEEIYEILTQSEFEEIINNIVESAVNKIDDALNAANITNNNIAHVLLTGGTCYIPAVQKRMRQKFGHRVENVKNADLLIAQGAAVISELEWMPFLTKDILIQLSDDSYWPIFDSGMPISIVENAFRQETFICTDSRQKIAKVLVYEGMNQRADKMLAVLNVPIPAKRMHGDEITIEAEIDKDIILSVRSYSKVANYPGMTSRDAYTERIIKEIYQICFGMDFMR